MIKNYTNFDIRDVLDAFASMEFALKEMNEAFQNLKRKMNSEIQYSIEEIKRKELYTIYEDLIAIYEWTNKLKEEIFVVEHPVIPSTFKYRYRRLHDDLMDVYSAETGLAVKTIRTYRHFYRDGTRIPSMFDKRFMMVANYIYLEDLAGKKLDCIIFNVVHPESNHMLQDADNIDTKSIPDTVYFHLHLNDSGENVHYYSFCSTSEELPEGTYYAFFPQHSIPDFSDKKIIAAVKDVMASCEAEGEEWVDLASFEAKNMVQK